MKIISSGILIFLLNIISLPFHKSESESETIRILPNIERLSKGYNIFKGNPESLSSEGYIDEGPRKYPIFEFTFSGKNDSITKYLVPDQMNFLSTSSDCSFSKVSSEITSEKSYYDSLKKTFSGSIGFEFGAFSKSKSYQNITETLNKHNQVLIKTGSQCILGTTELLDNKNLEFNRDFISTIKELSQGYNQEKYFEFFENYGTNYIYSATIGSKTTSNIFVKSSIYQKKLSSSYEWSKNAQLSYKISVSKGEGSEEEKKSSKEFMESKSFEYKTSIGIDSKNDNWNSVSKESPAILHYELQKISDLLRKDHLKKYQISEKTLKKIADAMDFYVLKYCLFLNNENPDICYGPKIDNNMKNKYQIVDSTNLVIDENSYILLRCPEHFLIVGAGYKGESSELARSYGWRIIEHRINHEKTELALRCKINDKEICYAICLRRPFLDPVQRTNVTKEITDLNPNIEISCPSNYIVGSCTIEINLNDAQKRSFYMANSKVTLTRKNERTCYLSHKLEPNFFNMFPHTISLTAVCLEKYKVGYIREGSSDLSDERSTCASNEYVVGCMPKSEEIWQDYSFIPEEKSCKCTNCIALCAPIDSLIGKYNKECAEEVENGNGCKECLPNYYGIRFRPIDHPYYEYYGETMLCFQKLCWKNHPVIPPKGKNTVDPCEIRCKSCNHECKNNTCTTCLSFPGGQEKCKLNCVNPKEYRECTDFCEAKIKSEYCHTCSENYYNHTYDGFCDSCNSSTSGFYRDGPPDGNSICSACWDEIPHCWECYGLGPFCTKCGPGYYLNSAGNCTTCQQEDEFISDHKCVKCTELFPNCLKCTANECQKCSLKTYLTERKICKECIELPVLQYENKCKICTEPYYLDINNVCTKCFVEEVGNCVKCIGKFPNCDFCELNSKKEFTCYKCSANYFLNSAKNCVKECDLTEYKFQEYCIKYPYPAIKPLEIGLIKNEIRFAKFINVCTAENNSSTANLNVYWISSAENNNIVPDIDLIKKNIPNNFNNRENLDYNNYKNYGLSEENNIIFPRSLHINYNILYYCSRGHDYTNIKNIGKLTLNANSTQSAIVYFLIDIQELNSNTEIFNLNKLICLVERLLDLERKNLLIAEKNFFCNDISNFESEKAYSYGIEPRKETIRFRTYMNPFYTNFTQYENDLKNKLNSPQFLSSLSKGLSAHVLNVKIVNNSEMFAKNNVSVNLKYLISAESSDKYKISIELELNNPGFLLLAVSTKSSQKVFIENNKIITNDVILDYNSKIFLNDNLKYNFTINRILNNQSIILYYSSYNNNNDFNEPEIFQQKIKYEPNCSELHLNCYKCYDIDYKCERCQNNFYLDLDKNCVSCTNKNELIIQNECKKCDQLFTDCELCNENECFKCVSGTYLSEKKKCKKCFAVKVFDEDQNQCKVCNEDYHLVDGVCKSCWVDESKCLNCVGKLAFCLSCQNKNSTLMCVKCQNNYYLDSNNNCKECNGPLEYTSHGLCLNYPNPKPDPYYQENTYKEKKVVIYDNVCVVDGFEPLYVYWISMNEYNQISNKNLENIQKLIDTSPKDQFYMDYENFINYGVNSENKIEFPRASNINYLITYYCSKGRTHINKINIGTINLKASSIIINATRFIIDIITPNNELDLNSLLCTISTELRLGKKDMLKSENGRYCGNSNHFSLLESEPFPTFTINEIKQSLVLFVKSDPFAMDPIQYQKSIQNLLQSQIFLNILNNKLNLEVTKIGLLRSEESTINYKNNPVVNINYEVDSIISSDNLDYYKLKLNFNVSEPSFLIYAISLGKDTNKYFLDSDSLMIKSKDLNLSFVSKIYLDEILVQNLTISDIPINMSSYVYYVSIASASIDRISKINKLKISPSKPSKTNINKNSTSEIDKSNDIIKTNNNDSSNTNIILGVCLGIGILLLIGIGIIIYVYVKNKKKNNNNLNKFIDTNSNITRTEDNNFQIQKTEIDENDKI